MSPRPAPRGGGPKRGGRPGAAGRPRSRRAPIGPRELALQVLAAAESRRAYADRLLESRLRDAALAPRDAALATTLVLGTLRHRALLDHHLAAFLGPRWEGLPLWIRQTLRLGALQMLVLTRIPAPAAVSESVTLAKKYGHPGTAGLANAVLRRLAGGERAPLPEDDPIARLAVLRSHPRWIVERWVARYGAEEADRLLAADNEEPRVTVRPSALRIDAADLARALAEEGIAARPSPNGGPTLVLDAGYVAARSRLFRDGLLSLQDEAEASVAALLGLRPGDRAADLCAAPGGKASQLVEAVAPGGAVVAMERHESRARALRENLLERLRLPRVLVVAGDARRPPLRGPFDGVLVDAPCSGLGVLRRRADARWRKEPATIDEMVALQAPILDAAAGLVRPGGTLVYSVCSLEPEETDEIVQSFLSRHGGFALDDARPFLPEAFRGEDGRLRALPHRQGTDGVFAARLVRR
ncbi:MAG: 16S rRNA (cytosine(967)-C(5))-methyltransferase RsmB [Hyphomicrobiales bacterium]